MRFKNDHGKRSGDSTSAIGVDLAIDFMRIMYRFRVIGFNNRFKVSHSLWVVYHDAVKSKSYEL
jgi:hypothetical protein